MMRQHAAADFDTMHSVMAELHELQLSVHDAEQVALNSSKAQEAALDFEETVLEQQVKHDKRGTVVCVVSDCDRRW